MRTIHSTYRVNGFLTRRIAKKYTAEHECVAFDDANGVGVISITDHAQSSLGDVVFVELPQVGTEVEQHSALYKNLSLQYGSQYFFCLEQIGAVESVKAASDIVSFQIPCC